LGLQGSCAKGGFRTSAQHATGRATGTDRAGTFGSDSFDANGERHTQAKLCSTDQHRSVAGGESGRAGAAQHGLAVVSASAGFGSGERATCCCSNIAESSARTIGRAEGGVCACERSAGGAGIAAAGRECSCCCNFAGSSAGRRTTQGGRHCRARRSNAVRCAERDVGGPTGGGHAGTNNEGCAERATGDSS
jgi:hypothetical protein